MDWGTAATLVIIAILIGLVILIAIRIGR